ncbi:MAG: DMT family transporter [Phycisphaerales bacterium]|nr:MAG: DMT family transporter [Phycisphaerales bacterium]
MLTELGPYIGPAAGVATAILWSATSLFFTAAGHRIGPTFVNATRILFATVFHAVTFRLLTGNWMPDMLAGQVLYLAVSGFIGLSLGDQALFTAFVDVGPRLAMLIMATSPLFAAFFGWVVLGETLRGLAWVGVTCVMAGVAWVVLERPKDTLGSHHKHRVRGIVCAAIGAACQAGGLLLSKQGIGHGWLPADQHMSAQAATLVRVAFGGVGMVPILAVYWGRERSRRVAGLIPDRAGSVRVGVLLTVAGAVVGPYLGVWMSLVASDRAPLGVAQTLCSMVPIFVLPFSVLVFKERVSPRAIIGAFLAVEGSALLFLPT